MILVTPHLLNGTDYGHFMYSYVVPKPVCHGDHRFRSLFVIGPKTLHKSMIIARLGRQSATPSERPGMMSNLALCTPNCRHCGREIRQPIPMCEVANNNEGVIIRCAKCDTTNRTKEWEPVRI